MAVPDVFLAIHIKKLYTSCWCATEPMSGTYIGSFGGGGTLLHSFEQTKRNGLVAQNKILYEDNRLYISSLALTISHKSQAVGNGTNMTGLN